MAYSEHIRNFIIDQFLFGDESQLSDDVSFLESGIIDSTGILELVTFLEETYSIKVEDTEMLPENFDSVNNVAEFIERKVAK